MEKFLVKRPTDDNEINEGNRKRKMKSKADDKQDDPNEDNESRREPEEDSREDEEKCFLNLFTEIWNTIKKIKRLDDDVIAEALRNMVQSFRSDEFHESNFTEPKNICAYIYRYGSHGAGLTRYRLLTAIRKCEPLKNVLRKPSLRIVSLGSGPGNSIVGFCSALSELNFPKELKLTLVDKFKQWSPWIQLAKIFIEEGEFGKVSELFKKSNVELKSVQTDLPGNLESDKEYFERLRNADVILMPKFLSSLDRKDDRQHEKDIIKSLKDDTKNDVVIIVIDILRRIRWEGFRLHQYGDTVTKDYKSLASADKRFNSNDGIASKLPIYVIVKENSN